MAIIEVKVPDIGDFDAIPVIEILVKPGDSVTKEDSLVTLESDKATMEVPSSHSGVVKAIKVKVGEKVSTGSVILALETSAEASAPAPASAAAPKASEPAAAPKASAPAAAAPTPAAAASEPKRTPAELRAELKSTLASLDADLHAEVLVLGSGPGGYTAAFRAADLGKKVVLVERYATLGGV